MQPAGAFDETRAAPSAPVFHSIVPDQHSLWVFWDPAVTHGTPVTGYRLTTSPAGPIVNTGASATDEFIEPLIQGVKYRVALVATSAHGDSPTAWSEPIQPTVCGAPRGPGPFPDVLDSSEFCLGIEWMAGMNITEGYSDGTFRPLARITRQAVAAYFYRYAGSPAFTPPATPTFSDVPVGHPFYKEIEWAAASNIAGGFGDGTYRPAGLVTRQAIAAFIYRAAGSPFVPPPASPPFTDVPLSHPFLLPIVWMVDQGIAAGYPDGSFHPAAYVTREATAAFFTRWDDLP